MKLGKAATYIGNETNEYKTGEQIVCMGMNYDDEIQPSYVFRSVATASVMDLYEEDIKWLEESGS